MVPATELNGPAPWADADRRRAEAEASAWAESMATRGGPCRHAETRRLLVEPWLAEVALGHRELSERDLLQWLAMNESRETSGLLPPPSPVEAGDQLPLSRASLLYAPAAAGLGQERPFAVYRRFRRFSRLDRGLGRDVSGLWLALLAAAFGDARTDLHCHYWLSETVRAWLPAWLSRDDLAPAEADALTPIRHELQNMISLGINLRGRSELSFLAAWRQEYVERTPDRPDKHEDALARLKLVTASLSYAGPTLARAFDVVAVCAEATPAAASMLGSLVGAFLGMRWRGLTGS